MAQDKVILDDCVNIGRYIPNESISLVYLDPPFLTGKEQKSCDRAGRSFSFSDVWEDEEAYWRYLFERLQVIKPLMKDDACIFLHCDSHSNYVARYVLNEVFGKDNFRSEIIWTYKRWSNSKKGLIPQHQTIFFFSKSHHFKWNQQYTAYSPTTNIDQILQKRTRDGRGKAVYARGENKNVIPLYQKKGVPLGDVWNIPFLNPKAKERTGYPTQKPVELLERIIKLTTDEDDLVVDPFCGSGTTLVASKLTNRRYIGLDISQAAVSLAQQRLARPVKSHSRLMKNGYETYEANDSWVNAHLVGFDISRIHRNKGADALLKGKVDGASVFLRVQRRHENIEEAVKLLSRFLVKHPMTLGYLIVTRVGKLAKKPKNVRIIFSPAAQLQDLAQPEITSRQLSML